MSGNPKLSPEDFFGAKAASAWRAVIDAAHRFAQLTDCLPGDDVFLWHGVKSEEFHKAVEAALAGLAVPDKGVQGDQGAARDPGHDHCGSQP